MPVSNTLNAVPDQFFDILGVAQQLVLTNTSAIVTSTRAVTSGLPRIPFSGRLQDMVALTGSTFDVASKLLASQRDFSIKLIEIYVPTPAAAKAKAA